MNTQHTAAALGIHHGTVKILHLGIRQIGQLHAGRPADDNQIAPVFRKAAQIVLHLVGEVPGAVRHDDGLALRIRRLEIIVAVKGYAVLLRFLPEYLQMVHFQSWRGVAAGRDEAGIAGMALGVHLKEVWLDRLQQPVDVFRFGSGADAGEPFIGVKVEMKTKIGICASFFRHVGRFFLLSWSYSSIAAAGKQQIRPGMSKQCGRKVKRLRVCPVRPGRSGRRTGAAR